jgi:S-adenosylmethionine decarboxylase proenzyme
LNALGRHLLLELKDCNKEVLNDLEFLKNFLREIAEQIGATVVNQASHKFSPQGVSCVVLIAESHICIHTWPEYSYASVDIFTCGNSIEPKDAINLIVGKLEAKESSFIELKRGILKDNKVVCGIK